MLPNTELKPLLPWMPVNTAGPPAPIVTVIGVPAVTENPVAVL
jgi:hypothetical protein